MMLLMMIMMQEAAAAKVWLAETRDFVFSSSHHLDSSGESLLAFSSAGPARILRGLLPFCSANVSISRGSLGDDDEDDDGSRSSRGSGNDDVVTDEQFLQQLQQRLRAGEKLAVQPREVAYLRAALQSVRDIRLAARSSVLRLRCARDALGASIAITLQHHHHHLLRQNQHLFKHHEDALEEAIVKNVVGVFSSKIEGSTAGDALPLAEALSLLRDARMHPVMLRETSELDLACSLAELLQSQVCNVFCCYNYIFKICV
jgi:hypothetical protein